MFHKKRIDTLLADYPVAKTADKDLLAAGLRHAYHVREIAFPQSDWPFFAIANRVQIKGTTLHFSHFGAPVRVSFADMDGFRLPIVLSGASQTNLGGRILEMSEHAAGIVPPHSSYVNSYGGGYSQLLLQFDEQALRRHFEVVNGKPFHGSILSHPLRRIEIDKVERMRAIALALALQFSRPGSENSITVMELEQALHSSFILENQLDQPVAEAPGLGKERDVSRLEDYIQGNWNRPLTVEDIARECNVSVRSVYARFQKKHGCSPMAYVRDIRLEHAYRTFQCGGDTTSVLTIALQCGFSSFGHFARRYKEKFGELPSSTLQRGRILAGAA